MLSIDHVEAPIIRDMPLPTVGATVFVVGAYLGDTVAFIREHHPNALIVAFEPQDWAYRKLVERFYGDPLTWVSRAALGTARTTAPLYEYHTDACSLLRLPHSREQGTAIVIPAQSVVYRFERIDLVVMNIEGYEYILVPHLAPMSNVVRLLVQEHKAFMPLDQDYSNGFTATLRARQRLEIGKGWYLYA